MSTIVAKEFEIIGTLGLPADKHSSTVPDASLFLNANDADTVQLGAGFIDAATMISYQTGQTEGLIEEWALDLEHDSLKCKIGGRDRMAEILEHEYDCSYLTAWPTVLQKQEMERLERTYKVGFFQASVIAREIAASCEMDLIWNCRDYTLREDFTTNGRAIDQINKLLDPWKQIPRFQADLYVVPGVGGKGAILVQARDYYTIYDEATGQFKPSTNCTFDVKDARIKNIHVSRKRSQRYKNILLYGQIVPVGIRNQGGSELYEETESTTKDENGRILTRTTTGTTYLMPDKRVLKVVTSTYQVGGGWMPTLTKRETRTNEWEPSQYSLYGLINEPKQLSQTTLIEASTTGTLRIEQKEYTGYAYDANDYLVTTATQKWQINQTSGRLEEYERLIKEHREVSHLEAEEVTTLYKPKSGGSVGNSGQLNTPPWYPAQIDVARSAGLRPGGSKPPRAISDSGPRLPLRRQGTISNHLRARSVLFQHGSLVESDLEYLYGCFEKSSGNWEWQISMSYLGIPWLRKGMVLYLTGMKDADGNTIPLAPALVTEQRLRYDESSRNPSMVSHLTAIFWTSDEGD
jgi:hypothetical protein